MSHINALHRKLLWTYCIPPEMELAHSYSRLDDGLCEGDGVGLIKASLSAVLLLTPIKCLNVFNAITAAGRT